MSIEEKVSKTLQDLGVANAQGVESLFAEVRAAMESERQNLIGQGARTATERDKLAKNLRDRWLARKNGLLSQIDEHWLKQASKEVKPAVGKQFNELRRASTCMEFDTLVKEVRVPPPQTVRPIGILSEEKFGDPTVTVGNPTLPPAQTVRPTGIPSLVDITLPGNRRPLGSLHPITRVQREIEEIFLDLGFWVEGGPEIESTYYSFDALNIPEGHPARDDWDTLYINPTTVLRPHTSPVQIRAMKKYGAPLHIVIPGKCYRHDNPDSSHSPMFHQMEGLAIDTDITFADLKGTLDFFAKKFFGEKVRTSFHPSFFPFTEPSGEVAVSCPFCDARVPDLQGKRLD